MLFTQERVTEKVNRNTDKQTILKPEQDLRLLIDIDNAIKAMQNQDMHKLSKFKTLGGLVGL